MKKIILLAILLLAAPFAFADEKTPPAPAVDLLKQVPSDKIQGDANAPVTLIEYASLSCPHCAAFARETMPKVEENYIKTGKVKYIYRHFPLNAPALKAAMLAECNADQYYAYIKILFDSQSKWAFGLDSTPPLRNIAKLGGMSDAAFDACLADKKLEDKIAAGRLAAEQNLKISSTPTIYVNQVRIEGSRDFDALAKIIDEELAKSAKR